MGIDPTLRSRLWSLAGSYIGPDCAWTVIIVEAGASVLPRQGISDIVCPLVRRVYLSSPVFGSLDPFGRFIASVPSGPFPSLCAEVVEGGKSDSSVVVQLLLVAVAVESPVTSFQGML